MKQLKTHQPDLSVSHLRVLTYLWRRSPMKRSFNLMRLLGSAVIVGILVGACAPAATPTPAPTDTAAPAATAAPATVAPTTAPATAAPTTAAPTTAPTTA